MITVVSEWYSNDLFRKAVIMADDDNGFYINCYERVDTTGEVWDFVRKLEPVHTSLHYVEDTAENWLEKIGAFREEGL